VREQPIIPRKIEIGDEAVWFDMTYRGLTCEKGTMRYGFAMGFGRPSNIEDTDFIKAVRKRARNGVHLVHNRYFTDRTLSAVEAEGREAKLFYFDCSGDGKLSDDEIFTPTNTEEYGSTKQYSFVTSDFVMESQAKKTVSMRLKLTASFHGTQDRPSCMWSPACILEGEAEVDGGKAKLILFMGGLSGNYTEFGRASYALLEADQGDMEYPPRATLSSLIFHNDKFYQLRFEGSHEDGKTLRVALVPDTSPTGHLAVNIKGREDLKAEVSYATVKGASDKSIHFRIRGSQEFPVDKYVLDSGQLDLGESEDAKWSVSFKGPEFSIEEGETSVLEFGEPKMTVSSIDENNRYSPDVKERDTFSTNDRIYLTPKVVGLKGETYSRFRKREGNRYSDVEPHLTVTDSSGKQIVSKNLEYG
jgi:hypothetical protein